MCICTGSTITGAITIGVIGVIITIGDTTIGDTTDITMGTIMDTMVITIAKGAKKKPGHF